MKRNKIKTGSMAILAASLAMAVSLSVSAMELAPATNGANAVPVTVTYAGSCPGAMIPKSIEFSGKSGNYAVVAFALDSQLDALDANVSIVPDASFTLTNQGGGTVTATVSQDKTTFTPADIKAGTATTVQATNSEGVVQNVGAHQAQANGTISVPDLTAGTWTGSLTFNIN